MPSTTALERDRRDYYGVLGVPADASPEEIRSAYRALARRYHPDSSQEPDAAQWFARVTAAYDVLGDAERRNAYDRWRIEAGIVMTSPLRLSWTLSRRSLPVLGELQVLYMLVEVSAAEQAAMQRLPLNVCLVVDRSTSMQGKRMERVKTAACEIIDNLGPEDSLSVVTFSDRAEVVVAARERLDALTAKARVLGIQPAGGTEILSGLVAALSELVQTRRALGVNHIILLTDGRTYGDENESVALAVEAGADGIGISAMGIGHDWNDRFLDVLAARTGGSSAYIDSPEKVGQFLNGRILGLGTARAVDLRLYLRRSAEVTLKHAFKLSPFPQELPVSEDGPLMLGTLEGTSPLSLILELHLGPQTDEGHHTLGEMELSGSIAGRIETIASRLRVEVLREPPAESPPSSIITALGKLTVHRMQERAYEAAENGDTQGATRSLETLATRLMALGQPELAQSALAEADRLTRTGRLSGEGRMRLKYGTRSLLGAPATKTEE